MNDLLNNMLPYEVILLIMGIIIFLALIFLLIWNVLKQRPIASFLPFFLFPVVMVGYPSIKSIQVGNDVIGIQKLTQEVNQNPKDSITRKNLAEAVFQLKSNNRLSGSKVGLIAVANAQIALGKLDSASLYIHKAERLSPESGEVKSLKEQLNTKMMQKRNFVQKPR